VGPVSGAANGFSYGYCTWWVAQKRYIPWRGNAAEWWWTARPFGVTEGATPRVGAVMVMGVSGTSPQGHVGYVESVNANGSFVVSEMNWWGVPGGGWNRVDYRTVTSMRGILGFIY
jgi:surface antigen